MGQLLVAVIYGGFVELKIGAGACRLSFSSPVLFCSSTRWVAAVGVANGHDGGANLQLRWLLGIDGWEVKQAVPAMVLFLGIEPADDGRIYLVAIIVVSNGERVL
ncbi:Hypothetical predicted protein [Olea europaea subsp. europaea]|uniref:Uncharacterized protein n=1 Tax=Olea europaea subsp. europaea TaxID=158383 RepID=A0A8S0V265_OLEEU|nr:Hypothetical predicted protein [Olea europaea subsp. europaea]